MQREEEHGPAPDPPLREELPERQGPAGTERDASSVEQADAGEPERESVPEDGDAAGVGTPASRPDRASLTP